MWRRGNKLWRLWIQLRASQFTIPVSMVLVFMIVLFLAKDNGLTKSSFGPQNQKWNSFRSSIKLEPSIDYRNGTDVISQIPISPKAVLFLAHGCGGKAANFWDKSEKCAKCIGLPEERLIVQHALFRNFAVITISSAGKCWRFGEEKEIVKEILEWWVIKNNLQRLPLTALGASSGGYFISALAYDTKFSSIALMIAAGVFDTSDILGNYPPTLFVHMPKDKRTKKLIGEYMEALQGNGVKVAEIKCIEIPLSPSTFSDRIPGLDQAVSVKLFELFREKGFVDEKGYMISDGRAINWKEALKGSEIFSSISKLTHHIQEEMNLAFAYHEMTSLHIDQIIDWFESNLK